MVICSNVLCNTLHLCYLAVYLLVARAIKYESIQFKCVAFELGEGLAWRRFEILVSFCLICVALDIASSLGFMMFVLGVLCHVGRFHLLKVKDAGLVVCI